MINPVLLIALPLLFAFFSLMFKKIKKQLLIFAAFLNIVLFFFMEKGEYIMGGFKPPYGINLVYDDYTILSVVVINVLFLLIILMSYEKIESYATVLLVALAGFNGMLLTGDLFNLFVFIEITSITAYILSSASKKYKYSFNYLILGTLGSGLYLFGLIIFYAVFGSLNMIDISSQINSLNIDQFTIPTLMIFIGIAIEVKLFPFNGWVRGVYGNADNLVSALLASVYAGAFLFVFGRLFTQVFIVSDYLKLMIVLIASFTLIAGEVAALGKTKIREILLYSSIAQSGLVAVLFISGLVFPAVLQLLNNIFAKAIMFTIGGKIYDSSGTDETKELQGAFLKNKIVGISFTVAAFSLIGLPVFFGFYSKVNLLLGVFSVNNYWLPILILVSTVIEGAYFIRLLVKLWTPGEEHLISTEEFVTVKKLEFEMIKIMGVALIAAILLITGLIPGYIEKNLTSSGHLLSEETPSYMFDIKGGI